MGATCSGLYLDTKTMQNDVQNLESSPASYAFTYFLNQELGPHQERVVAPRLASSCATKLELEYCGLLHGRGCISTSMSMLYLCIPSKRSPILYHIPHTISQTVIQQGL